MKTNIKKFIALLLSLVIVFNMVACSSDDGEKGNSSKETEMTVKLIGGGDPNSPYSGDDLVTISINEINVNEINVVSIDPKDIVVNSIEIEEINSIEMQVIPLNDQIVSLAYENFKSVYGDNINIKKLVTNVAIGAVCVVICVALTYVGGGVGAYFGVVISKGLGGLALAIGAAIDAAVSGYKAYEEGGDLAYILGHMVNGVAEGFMWMAILAPLTSIVDGIKALKAIGKLRKLPGFSDLSDKAISQVFKNLSKVLRETKDLPSNASDDVIRALYASVSKELREEIAEDVFINMVRNKSTLVTIARSINPLGIRKDVIDVLRENYWADLDSVSDDIVRDTIKQIQSGKINSLDDISNVEIREFIKENSVNFIDCYSDKFSDEFVENWLKETLGEDTFQIIKKSITESDGLVKIAKSIGHKSLSDIMDNPEQYMLLVKRFGEDRIGNLRAIDSLYRLIVANTSVSDDAAFEVIDKLFEGGYDLSGLSLNSTIRTNLTRYGESISHILKTVGIDSKNDELLKDLAVNSLASLDGISDGVARDIVSSGMRKNNIINKYGDDVWNIIVDNGYSSINSFNVISEADSDLIRDIAYDSLVKKGISSDVIETILHGESSALWDLNDKEIVELANIVSEYYRTVDDTMYGNFVLEYAEIRGKSIEGAINTYKKGNTIINMQYAGGIMVPTGENADYILQKYGQIQMSSYGFAIFDEYSVARVVIEDLTGDEAEDIARANLIHHGVKTSIPGYTWHHIEDGKTLILIPTELHEAYRHTGGAALIREGLL